MLKELIKLLLPLGIKMLMNYYENVEHEREDKKAFLKYVEAVNKTSGTSAKMKVAAGTARDKLKERMKALKG